MYCTDRYKHERRRTESHEERAGDGGPAGRGDHRGGRRTGIGDLAPARRRGRDRPRAERLERIDPGGDRRRSAGEPRAGRGDAGGRGGSRSGEGGDGPRGRPLRRSRRSDQQRRRPLSERPHSQPAHRRLGAGVSSERPRCRERDTCGGPRHAHARVWLDRANRFSVGHDSVVARGAVLRHESGRHPAGEGRCARVRPRRDTRELHMPRNVSFCDPRGCS